MTLEFGLVLLKLPCSLCYTYPGGLYIGDRKEETIMSTLTIDDLSKLINSYILAQAERDAERARLDAERDAERAKLDAEIKKDYEKRWKRLEQELGRLGNSYGDQVEAMFVNLGAKFNALGYSFPKEAKGNIKFLDENRKVLAEIDHLLENGSVVMPIEVKAKLKQEYVDDHIKRLGIISEYNIKNNDNRKVLGAVAGGVVPQNVLKYAQKRGLYVLVQNGESVEIADIPANFKPHEW